MSQELLDDLSKNWIEYEKMQWLTQSMSVPGNSKVKNLTPWYSTSSNAIFTQPVTRKEYAALCDKLKHAKLASMAVQPDDPQDKGMAGCEKKEQRYGRNMALSFYKYFLNIA